MTDFMGNAPAEIASADVLSVFFRFYRNTCHHTRDRSPFDADMSSTRIHKRACKHSLITDILTAYRHFIVCGSLRILAQTFVLVEQIDHIIHCLHGITELFRFLLTASVSKTAQYLRRCQREHHIAANQIRSLIDTVLRIPCMLCVVCHMECFCFTIHLFERIHIDKRFFHTFRRIRRIGQIQYRDLCSAADTDSVFFGSLIAFINNIKLAAALQIHLVDRLYRNFIRSDL